MDIHEAINKIIANLETARAADDAALRAGFLVLASNKLDALKAEAGIEVTPR